MQNMGTTDRLLRILIAAVIGALYLTGQLTGTAAIILGVIALALLVTGVVGTCPGYLPLDISTRKKT
jgi:glucose uptake protein GlcU